LKKFLGKSESEITKNSTESDFPVWNSKDWTTLIENMHPGNLYHPAPKSSSSDLYFIFQQRSSPKKPNNINPLFQPEQKGTKMILSFQWKLTKKLTFKTFQEEIEKGDVKDKKIEHSLVILAPDKIAEWMKQGEPLENDQGYYFDSKSKVVGKVKEIFEENEEGTKKAPKKRKRL